MLPKPVKDEHTHSISLSAETNVQVPMRDGTVLHDADHPSRLILPVTRG